MSELRDKLRRAFRVDVTGPAEPQAPSGAVAPYAPLFAEVLRRHRDRALRRQVAVALPPGEDLHGERGTCWWRRLDYGLDVAHGRHTFGDALRVEPAQLRNWARGSELAPSWRDCLFLDTETTGLAGGAGTVVFACGLGFFDGDRLVVEQVFLRAFAEEPAALAHVARRLAERPWLVTYVGKSFDRHRLAARMAVHKIAAPLLTAPHVDLYYLARRAFGSRLADVRLRTVETEVLGLRRVDDLPGAAAPAAFLDWIRDRSGAVDRVLEHNRLDVLSLVVLLAALGGG